MSGPRPYEKDPFHPLSSVRVFYEDQFLYIYKTVPHISSMWYLHCVLENCTFVIYACALLELQRHFEVILHEYWNELVRNTARHCYFSFFFLM